MKFACVGDNCIDYYVKDDLAFCGGNPVNVAVYIKRLGGDSSYIGAVGTDKYGKLMLESLSDKGVDTSKVHICEGTTALCQVVMVNGDRVLGDYDEGVMSDFSLSDDDIDWLSEQDIVISGLWGHAENDLAKIKNLSIAKSEKNSEIKPVVIAFDCADRPYDPVAVKAVPACDIVFFSDDSSDEPEIKNILRDLYSKGPKVIIVTRGSKGSICYDGEKFWHFGITKVDVVDTMGAGDSYIAGFLYSYMKGNMLLVCMKDGAETAAVTISYSGAW